MSPVSLALRAKVSLDGKEAEKWVASVILDDTIRKFFRASNSIKLRLTPTYGDDTCNQIFEILTIVMSSPMDHSVLAVEKSLVICLHILIYGSEK